MRDKFKGKEYMKKYMLLALLVFVGVGCTAQNDIKKDETIEDKRYSAIKAEVINNDFLTESALHDAVRANDLEMVTFLIKQGAQIDLEDQYGFTPLHLAVRLHNLEIVEYLISKDSNVNTIDVYLDTPLLDATRNNDTDIAKVLICNGAYRNVSDIHKMSTLNNSSKNNNKYISELLRADTVEPYCQEEIDINIDDSTTSKICGKITKGYITELKVNLEDKEQNSFGEYDAIIDNKNNSWCADISKDELIENEYLIMAKASDKVVNTADAQKTQYLKKDFATTKKDKKITQAEVLPGLYEALMSEFKDDFEPWKAELDKDSLTFRFTDPAVLFERAKEDLKPLFKDILSSFFPRYITTLVNYQEKIDSIIIEGHSSSEHRLGKTPEEKYELNKILSEKRATEVLRYTNGLEDERVLDNIVWVLQAFQAQGLSSSNLVYNEDGTENQEASRRVEFRIETNSNPLNN